MPPLYPPDMAAPMTNIATFAQQTKLAVQQPTSTPIRHPSKRLAFAQLLNLVLVCLNLILVLIRASLMPLPDI
jgi:hypothetical protein